MQRRREPLPHSNSEAVSARSAVVSSTGRAGTAAVEPPTATGDNDVLPGKSLDQYSGDPDFMMSLARGLTVVQAFSQQNSRMTISELSRETGLSRAAVRRCLYTLTRLGFAGTEDGSRYSLRARMLTLSHSFTNSNALTSAAQPILERMSALHRESFSVATLDGDDIVYVARTTVSRVMAVDLQVGSRLPAYCTSMGRVLLAYLPAEQLESYMRRVELVPFTSRTVASADRLMLLLRGVRRNGYALCDQEYEVGLRSLAVPVHAASGRVVATLNLSGTAPRLSTLEMQTRFLPHLRTAAHELGALLR